jgi:hypothetical protein
MSKKRVRDGTPQRLPRRQARNDKRVLLRRRTRIKHQESHGERQCQNKYCKMYLSRSNAFSSFCDKRQSLMHPSNLLTVIRNAINSIVDLELIPFNHHQLLSLKEAIVSFVMTAEAKALILELVPDL